ncbi:MAG: leucine-rich repeat domain-containing protein [Lachnospiraceae bacterium]|nr:leucine-rich repeat domain-containing protein [Lachnospiraceae bacterium]
MEQPTVRRNRKRRLRLRRVIGASLILLAVLIWNVPGFARAASTDPAIAAGQLSGGVSWQINETGDGSYWLFISGNGEIPSVGDAGDAPFRKDSPEMNGFDPANISVVQIEDGVTLIGKNSLSALTSLEKILITDSVREIEANAFPIPDGADSITLYLYHNDSEEAWKENVTIHSSMQSILDRLISFESGVKMPTPGPSAAPTETPTAEPSPTATAAPSATPAPTATVRPSATPTAAPTATRAAATPTATTRATATATTRATSTATSSARPTATATNAAATPTSTPAPTATAYVANISNNNNFYNPYAVVRNTGNAKDMPRTGDGDAARYLIVAALFVLGCIVLISSIPGRRNV